LRAIFGSGAKIAAFFANRRGIGAGDVWFAERRMLGGPGSKDGADRYPLYLAAKEAEGKCDAALALISDDATAAFYVEYHVLMYLVLFHARRRRRLRVVGA
jgi:hypothetical protein